MFSSVLALLLVATSVFAAPPSPAGTTEPDPSLQVAVQLKGKSFINKVNTEYVRRVTQGLASRRI